MTMSADAPPGPEASPAPPSSATQSLDRALSLLELVVGHAKSGIGLVAIAEQAGLKKPTAHRLLAGLRNAGLVDYHARTRSFMPSFKLFQMGLAAGARFDVTQVAGPILDELALATGDSVYLSVRNGDTSVCVARRIGAFPIRTLTLEVGDVRPLGLGAGSLALLAWLPEAECAGAIERNREQLRHHANFTADVLPAYAERTRALGYALNDGLMLPEMAGLAVPVREPYGTVCAAISVAAIRSRLQMPRRELVLAQLRAAAARIESALTKPT